MKLNPNTDGLSARRWTIKTFKTLILNAARGISRKKLWPVAIAIMLCSCQENKKTENAAEEKPKKASTATDSLNKPNVNIKVNKHYDDKGNLVGFDSTYSSYYSNITGDTAGMDSLMQGFNRYFNRNRSLLFDDRLDDLFFNDSTRYPDFFHDDFFLKRYELNDAYMRDMMKQMDSLKNNFFYEQSKERKAKDL